MHTFSTSQHIGPAYDRVADGLGCDWVQELIVVTVENGLRESRLSDLILRRAVHLLYNVVLRLDTTHAFICSDVSYRS